MLVMRRRPGERFRIGDDIEIEVLEVGAGKVKLGIVAPEDVAIVREEVRLTRQENLSAARHVAPSELTSLVHLLSANRREDIGG